MVTDQGYVITQYGVVWLNLKGGGGEILAKETKIPHLRWQLDCGP